MEDGAKENTALNIQKPLEILVTDEDKHGTDIACMSDFFGIYIEQLSAELSNQVMRGVVEKIPAADVQILGELVHGVDVLLSGKYGYIPDFDSLPNDVKDKLKKGIYTLGESRQVEDNVRAVVLDENGTRIKDVTLKRVLNTPDTLEMSRSITSQVQMRQIAAKLDEIAETQSYLIEMERNNNIIKPFLNARDLILRAQNAKTIDERKHYMIEASKELNDVINASRLDLKTSSEHLAKLTRFPILRNSSQCNVAISLVPIIRGEKLMLVGDPQQLNPVILLGELTNKKLRRRYHVSDEYDYRENSIYKTYLACDAVSDEVLLRNHYRCNKEIIGFNNKKYYNSKLKIQSKSKEPEPLVYMDVKSDNTQIKNTSPAEVEEVVEYALLNKDKSIAVITPFVNQKQLIENAIKQNKLSNLVCGTVHAFQGDEKDVVLFSTAISERTSSGTYNWLKNNKELINVATSRAKEKLVLLTNGKELERLHAGQADDDLYELAQYIKTNGHSKITEKHISSRALGIQPFSTATENAFLENLTHALENIWLSQSKYVIHKEVAISQVFRDNITYDDLFYMGRFDFVVYEKQGRSELPILAIELDGKEHFEDAVVKERDRKKNAICKAHNMEIIRVENSYARRYNHIKGILMDYFSRVH